jgi:hypothetical protein
VSRWPDPIVDPERTVGKATGTVVRIPPTGGTSLYPDDGLRLAGQLSFNTFIAIGRRAQMNRAAGQDRNPRTGAGAGSSAISAAGSKASSGTGATQAGSTGRAGGMRWVGFTLHADPPAGVT